MTQETFLRAYTATQKRKIDFPKAYLFKVARNVAFAELSKKNRQLTDYLEELPTEEQGDGNAVDDELIAQQRVKLYCDAIAEMPPRCRRVFLMRKVHAMTHKEIAEELGVTVSAVERNITRGLVQFKRYVDSRDADEMSNGSGQSEAALTAANPLSVSQPSRGPVK
jgi:RNA polymerase sigma-70 factor (ECF subfamily)